MVNSTADSAANPLKPVGKGLDCYSPPLYGGVWVMGLYACTHSGADPGGGGGGLGGAPPLFWAKFRFFFNVKLVPPEELEIRTMEIWTMGRPPPLLKNSWIRPCARGTRATYSQSPNGNQIEIRNSRQATPVVLLIRWSNIKISILCWPTLQRVGQQLWRVG